MRTTKRLITILVILLLMLAISCSRENVEVTELKNYPINGINSVLTESGVDLDKQVTSDGNGSGEADHDD